LNDISNTKRQGIMSITGILSDESISAYWAQLDTDVFSAIGKMSSVDKAWSMDNVPVVLKACEELGQKLSSDAVLNSAAAQQKLLNQEDIKMTLEVMSSLQSARGLRIFRWLEQYQPEFSAELLEAASHMQDDHSALLFLERMRVLNKLHLISRIFSYNRLKMIIDRLSEMKSKGTMNKLIDETKAERLNEPSPANAAEEVDEYVDELTDLISNSAGDSDDEDDEEQGGW